MHVKGSVQISFKPNYPIGTQNQQRVRFTKKTFELELTQLIGDVDEEKHTCATEPKSSSIA